MEPAGEAKRVLDAKVQLRRLLETEHALIKAEAIARLGERYYGDDPRNIDSHITGKALQEMRFAGEIEVAAAVRSKGGHEIDTITAADTKGRKTVITAASRRKRALYARYLSWAASNLRYPNGYLGPAGEAATRAAILASAALQPALPGAAAVPQLLGVTLPGALDSAGYMIPIIQGVPQAPVTVIFEVKNIRDWIYPSNSELFQVLRKGIVLQQAHPSVPIVPILICRKAHVTTFYMAQQLGFLVIEMSTQYVGTNVSDLALTEVRNELEFNDLRHGNGPSLRVRDRLTKTFPPIIHQYAKTWSDTALDPEIAPLLTQCGRRQTSAPERFALIGQLRIINQLRGKSGGW